MRKIALLFASFIYAAYPIFAQQAGTSSASQHGVVYKITRSASDVRQPVAGVSVTIDGVTSKPSNTKGEFALSVPSSRKFKINKVRRPNEMLLVTPKEGEEKYYDKNKLCIVLTTKEEKDTELHRLYSLFKQKYEEEHQKLISLCTQHRRELAKMKKDMAETDARYIAAKNSLDSLEKIRDGYLDNEDEIEKNFMSVAEELSMTDYQSLEEEDRLIFEKKQAGDWESVITLIKQSINGDVRSYLSQGSDNLAKAQEIEAKAIERRRLAEQDRARRFKRVEDLVHSFLIKHQNDSVRYYYKLLSEEDSTNTDYLEQTGWFEHEYMSNDRDALSYIFRANNIIKMKYGETSSELALNMYYIGQILKDMGDLKTSYEYLNTAVNILNEQLGPLDKNTLDCWRVLADVEMMQGNYESALDTYKVLEMVYITRKEENSVNLSRNYTSMGNAYLKCRDYQKSLLCHQKAYQIDKTIYGENHPDLARSLMNVGLAYMNLEDFENAKSYLLEAKNLFLTFFGTQHLETASILVNIGSLYRRTKDYPQALECITQAFDILKNIYGDEPRIVVAQCLNNIGFVYSDQNDFRKALEYFEPAYQIKKMLLGEQHKDVITIAQNMAFCYNYIAYVDISNKDYTGALANVEKAIKLHPELPNYYDSKGEIYMLMNRQKEAKEMYTRVINIKPDFFDNNHTAFYKLLFNEK